eukprot:Em0030g33a
MHSLDKASDSVSLLKSRNLSTAYTNLNVLDTELGKETTAGWIINDPIKKEDLSAHYSSVNDAVALLSQYNEGKDQPESCLPPDSSTNCGLGAPGMDRTLVSNLASIQLFLSSTTTPMHSTGSWLATMGLSCYTTWMTSSWLGPSGKDTCQEAMYRMLLCCSIHQHCSVACPPDKLKELRANQVLVIQAQEPEKTEADSLQLFTDALGSLGFGNGGVHSTNTNSTPLGRDLNYHLQFLPAKFSAASTACQGRPPFRHYSEAGQMEKLSIRDIPPSPLTHPSDTRTMAAAQSHNVGTELVSEHFGSFALCFLTSASSAAAPSDKLAAVRIEGIKGEVTVMSRAACFPLSQVVAWLPRRSRAKPGHREHEEPLAVSIPSHYWMEICSSLGSKCRSRPGPVARMQHEVLTQRAAEPCRQVMMLPTTKRTGGPLVSLTVPFGGQVRL